MLELISIYNTKKMITAFTDGSSIANGKPNCISGCGVYFSNTEKELSISSKMAAELCNIKLEIESNNVGELLAILVALHFIEEKKEKVVICSDSMYCINSVTRWWEKWEKNNWNTSSGTPVKNKHIIKEILKKMESFKDLQFKHVKGHKKEPEDQNSEEWKLFFGNNKADRLAFFSIRDNLKMETSINKIVE